jgi:Flp pilus assembly protein TadG
MLERSPRGIHIQFAGVFDEPRNSSGTCRQKSSQSGTSRNGMIASRKTKVAREIQNIMPLPIVAQLARAGLPADTCGPVSDYTLVRLTPPPDCSFVFGILIAHLAPDVSGFGASAHALRRAAFGGSAVNEQVHATQALQRFRRLRRLAGDDRGVNLIEAAIVSPLFVLIVFAILEYATIIYVHEALQNGVSQATRFGVTGRLQAQKDRVESMKSIMRQATPTLTLDDAAFQFTHIPPNGKNWVAGTGGPGAIERLRVTYTWPIVTPVLKPFFDDGSITFQVESTMKNERNLQL